ncbi:hypothetical protein HZH68_015507 [Vespula germanica]|uniref:Uncharacterized protein n=1 Tax=Vespula germanica TaxID=30212 RepID=A0A834J605_VESGE|nr:hypothetical protein HZH68_015507 [Vespula germanica]
MRMIGFNCERSHKGNITDEIELKYLENNFEKLTGSKYSYIISVGMLTVNFTINGIKMKMKIQDTPDEYNTNGYGIYRLSTVLSIPSRVAITVGNSEKLDKNQHHRRKLISIPQSNNVS